MGAEAVKKLLADRPGGTVHQLRAELKDASARRRPASSSGLRWWTPSGCPRPRPEWIIDGPCCRSAPSSFWTADGTPPLT
ncbi:MAG: hypothetical protein V8S34_07535 [Lawsonibacter sp.]